MQTVKVTVNGKAREATVDERTLLLHLIREELGLTGIHNGCLEARCGCCAVLVDGQAVKSCNVLAVQVDGASITTIEGLAPAGEATATTRWVDAVRPRVDSEAILGPLQEAFHRHGAVQCGFCTPGMLAVLTDFLSERPNPTEDEVRAGICGNLCRCTGYQKIVDAAMDAARSVAGPITGDLHGGRP